MRSFLSGAGRAGGFACCLGMPPPLSSPGYNSQLTFSPVESTFRRNPGLDFRLPVTQLASPPRAQAAPGVLQGNPPLRRVRDDFVRSFAPEGIITCRRAELVRGRGGRLRWPSSTEIGVLMLSICYAACRPRSRPARRQVETGKRVRGYAEIRAPAISNSSRHQVGPAAKATDDRMSHVDRVAELPAGSGHRQLRSAPIAAMADRAASSSTAVQFHPRVTHTIQAAR